MCARRSPIAPRSPASRSAVTNRSRVHQKGDERSANARRYRDLIASFSVDLGDDISESDMAMIRTAAGLTLKSELLHADLVAGRDVDADQLIRLAGTSRRALAAVSARAEDRKPPAQTFADYLARKAAERAALESDETDDED
jgi:ribosomal protein L12E/L44/L45/RPP1/RPP2